MKLNTTIVALPNCAAFLCAFVESKCEEETNQLNVVWSINYFLNKNWLCLVLKIYIVSKYTFYCS